MSNLGNAYVLASALYARDRSLPLGEIADNIYDCVDAINFGIDERKADLYTQLEHKLTPTTTFLDAVDIIVLAMDRTDRSYPQHGFLSRS